MIFISKMAVLESSPTSSTRENKMKTDKKHLKKVLLVSQELKLARVLAGNSKTSRDRALKSLRKWFQNRSNAIPFTEDDFTRLWKGLFYSMWMSDKPLVQEECAENISQLVHFLPFESALLFYKCSLAVLITEWFGIDQLRLDKFLMFVRRLLRQILFVLKNQEWSRLAARKFAEILAETVLNTEKHRPTGLLMHFSEIFLEEVAKVSEGKLPGNVLTDLLAPFIKQLAYSDDKRLLDHLKRHVFVYLMQQSDLGMEYKAKYEAWKRLRFPGNIDAMQKVEESENSDDGNESDNEIEQNGSVFDPRAGKVDVILPQLKFHSKQIAKALAEFKFDKKTNLASRKMINDLTEKFRKMASGVYPLGVKKVRIESSDYDTSIRKAVNRLVKFDKKIMGNKNAPKRKAASSNDEREVSLRNGKKIKLNDNLQEQLVQQFDTNVKRDSKRKKKRSAGDKIAAKVPKIDEFASDIESIFRRNSGTWLVTRTDDEKTEVRSPKRFAEESWDWEPKSEAAAMLESLRKGEGGAGPVGSPPLTKKVKINTRLNRSQDVDEHISLIRSSPAIPYDASRKPTKTLLKSKRNGPINPFYKAPTKI